MLIKERYSIKDLALWTRWETTGFILFTAIVTLLFDILQLTFLAVPWTPVALIGTAVAFIVGFQNNAAYGRIWEARKIWGGIVNTSRTWGMKVQDMVTNEYSNDHMSAVELMEEKRKLVYRHIAWMTALRFAMRENKKWEVFEKHRTNKEWSNVIYIPEKVVELGDELRLYLDEDERKYVMSKNNKQTALLYMQSKHIRELKEKGFIWEFAFLELENVLGRIVHPSRKVGADQELPIPETIRLFVVLFCVDLFDLDAFGYRSRV